MDRAFELYPELRGYVLDEHGALRFHMAMMVCQSKIDRGWEVPDTARIFVLQALSGSRFCTSFTPWKGLFTAHRQDRGGWVLTGVSFLGDNVSLAMQDPRTARQFALDHGHFGAKLHRSRTVEHLRTFARPAYPTPPVTSEWDFLGRELPGS